MEKKIYGLFLVLIVIMGYKIHGWINSNTPVCRSTSDDSLYLCTVENRRGDLEPNYFRVILDKAGYTGTSEEELVTFLNANSAEKRAGIVALGDLQDYSSWYLAGWIRINDDPHLYNPNQKFDNFNFFSLIAVDIQPADIPGLKIRAMRFPPTYRFLVRQKAIPSTP